VNTRVARQCRRELNPVRWPTQDDGDRDSRESGILRRRHEFGDGARLPGSQLRRPITNRVTATCFLIDAAAVI
jgi:hypothetical protein